MCVSVCLRVCSLGDGRRKASVREGSEQMEAGRRANRK